MDIERFNNVYKEETNKISNKRQYAAEIFIGVLQFWHKTVLKQINNITDEYLDNTIAEYIKKDPYAKTFKLRQTLNTPIIYKDYIKYNYEYNKFNSLWKNTIMQGKCENVDMSVLKEFAYENHYSTYHRGKDDVCYLKYFFANEYVKKYFMPAIEYKLSNYGLTIVTSYVSGESSEPCDNENSVIYVEVKNPCIK